MFGFCENNRASSAANATVMTLAITPPILSFGHSGVEYENGRIRAREVLEIIAGNLSKAA